MCSSQVGARKQVQGQIEDMVGEKARCGGCSRLDRGGSVFAR